MIQELLAWLDRHNIDYKAVDPEVVEIPGFGRLFAADLSGVDSIFRGEGDNLTFNLMERPEVLMEEGIHYIAFPFGRNWYYYDLRETFRFNILKYVGCPKPPKHDIPFVNLGIHTPYELLNASGSLETWCRKAKWLGHTAVGISDRNTMAATLNLQKECAKAGLKHVFGYSLTMQYDEEPVEVKVYARNNEGLHNLLRIQRTVMVDCERPAPGQICYGPKMETSSSRTGCVTVIRLSISVFGKKCIIRILIMANSPQLETNRVSTALK